MARTALALALLALPLALSAQTPAPSPASAPASAASGTAAGAPGSEAVTLPLTGKTLVTEGVDWHARAEAWFEATDEKSRKAQMKTATKALKQPCKYCHTPDFQGYTEKKLVAQQMMALSKDHGVPCGDCHAGKDRFTALGRTAHEMWALSIERGVTCEHCHVPAKRFEVLTAEGEKARKKP